MALIDKLTAIGDAIRAKTGSSARIALADMPAAITGITTGAPTQTLTYSQINPIVAAYLSEVVYDPSDYTSSSVSTYADTSASYPKHRPSGVTVSLPSAGALTVYGDKGAVTYNNVAAGNVVIDNITPGTVGSYVLKDSGDAILAAGLLKPSGTLRMINGGGDTFNIRDLGGWACDGGTIKYGRIYRGCELNGDNYNITLTDEQRSLFTDFLGIRDEIDLRGNSEVDGDDQTYGTDDDITDTALDSFVDYIRYPIAPYASGINTASAIQTAYYGALIKRIANDVRYNRPCYIHCMAGADRTGTLCALIEALCGVSQSDIDKDYELTSFSSGNTRIRSNQNWTGFIDAINAFGGDTFRDKVVAYALRAGVTIAEINTLRSSLIDGTPEELVEPSALPSAYQEVEWIASSGSQTIQIPFDSTFVGAYIEMDIKRTDSGVRGLIGSANTNSATIAAAAGSYFGWNASGNYEMGDSSVTSVAASTSSFDHIKFEWYANGSGKLTVNGTELTSRSGSGAYSKWNLFGGSTYPVSCQMKAVKVYNITGGGSLTAHLIPCYRKSDSVIGMYDIVSDTFYTNIGTGSFTIEG